MSAINHFVDTLKIIGLKNNLTPEEAQEKAWRLKKLNEKKPKDNSRLQIWLDWLASPVSFAITKEEAEADAITTKAYWEAIAIRDGSRQSQVHQHLHLHGVDEQMMKKAKAYQELEELEKRKMKLMRELEES